METISYHASKFIISNSLKWLKKPSLYIICTFTFRFFYIAIHIIYFDVDFQCICLKHPVYEGRYKYNISEQLPFHFLIIAILLLSTWSDLLKSVEKNVLKDRILFSWDQISKLIAIFITPVKGETSWKCAHSAFKLVNFWPFWTFICKILQMKDAQDTRILILDLIVR